MNIKHKIAIAAVSTLFCSTVMAKTAEEYFKNEDAMKEQAEVCMMNIMKLANPDFLVSHFCVDSTCNELKEKDLIKQGINTEIDKLKADTECENALIAAIAKKSNTDVKTATETAKKEGWSVIIDNMKTELDKNFDEAYEQSKKALEQKQKKLEKANENKAESTEVKKVEDKK